MSAMKSTLRLALVVMCAATAGTAAQPASNAASNPAGLPERVPVLRIVAIPGFRVASFQKATGGELALIKGERSPSIAIEADAPSACWSRLSAPGGPGIHTPNASVSWLVGASLVSVAGDEATVDLRWHRRVPRGGVLLERSLEQVDRLVLRDGARGVVDMVHAAPGVSSACSHFALGLELQFRSPGNDVMEAGLGYELWLVDRAQRSQVAAVRARAMSRQGRNAEYAFPPVSLPGANEAVSVNVSGAINGEARADGSIELNVDYWQGVSTEKRGSASGGRKRLTVRDGETVEFELPAELRAKLPEDLRQHDFALRVTTERLW
jgi:hypothetical protein